MGVRTGCGAIDPSAFQQVYRLPPVAWEVAHRLDAQCQRTHPIGIRRRVPGFHPSGDTARSGRSASWSAASTRPRSASTFGGRPPTRRRPAASPPYSARAFHLNCSADLASVFRMLVIATHVSSPAYDLEFGLEALSSVLFAERPGSDRRRRRGSAHRQVCLVVCFEQLDLRVILVVVSIHGIVYVIDQQPFAGELTVVPVCRLCSTRKFSSLAPPFFQSRRTVCWS